MKGLFVTLALLWCGAAQADVIGNIGLNQPNGRWGSGNISAYRSYCHTDLCDYQLNWNVYGQNATVVLEVRGGPEHGTVKLFACSGSHGNQGANWIRRDGAQYIFHLYDTQTCSRDVFYREYAASSVVIQEFPGGNGGGGTWGYDNIDAFRTRCYSDLCEYQIEWSVTGQNSVVTVVDPQTGREKLFACSGQTGQQAANWIRRDGSRYEFRLYDSSRCAADVGRYSSRVDRIVVRER